MMEHEQLKRLVEAALLVADRPLAVNDLERLFAGDTEAPPRDALRRALADLAADCAERSFELREVASGFRLQVREEFAPWLSRLWDEKPARYSRALLETLAIIAYRQPVTRPEIEDIRGVSVSSQIMRTLQERQWVRVVGHRDSPGQPAMFGTTREFLDHFNLKTLDQLPSLADVRDLDQRYPELAFEAEPGRGDATAVDGQAEELGAASDDAAIDAGAVAIESADHADTDTDTDTDADADANTELDPDDVDCRGTRNGETATESSDPSARER